MHFHFIRNQVTSKDREDEKEFNLHYHNIGIKETTRANDVDSHHKHILDNILSTAPIKMDEIKAQENQDGEFELTLGSADNQITRKMTEKEALKELQKIGVLSDADLEVSSQLGTNLLEQFADTKKAEFIFPADSNAVKDNQDHFPINTIERARNALARASQSDFSWYTGTKESGIEKIKHEIRKKYPSLEVE